jgi:galactokinase
VNVRALALHALEEAARVSAAVDALNAGDAEAFGRFLRESHASLRDHLRAPAVAQNALCKAMNRAGALGSRPLQSGQVGAVVRSDEVEAVLTAARDTSGLPAEVVTPVDGWALCT